MGYRSDVAYKIKFVNKEDFWGFIAESKLDPDTALCFDKQEEWGDSFIVDEERYEICFLAEGWKWYDEYPEVKCHQALWEKAEARCDEDNIEVEGAWCRTGEESDDNDERYFGDDPYDMVRISRQVVVDWA
jgi:hypothetical protein